MSVSDPSTEIRISVLQACANIPDEEARLNDAVERCLDDSDLLVRLNAIQMLHRVELKPQREVDAAIASLELRYRNPERRGPMNELPKSDDQEVRGEVVSLWSKYVVSVALQQSQPDLSGELNDVSPKILAYAEQIIGRYDKDGSRSLDEQEWKPMLMSPASADLNQDHIVTVEEYALRMHNRSKR